jgi:N-acylneuraminate cytidylyltransferase
MRIAVVPARGGSKRIPRKNIRPFCGRPILAWPIEIARGSGLFEHVLVSTDDPEIAALAEREGAEAPFVRPTELADDFATTADVVAHAADWATAQGWPLAAVCCIYPTAPLLEREDLRRGLEALNDGWDFAFSATPFESSVFRAFRELPEGGVEMLFPEHAATRTQDLPRALHDAGQFYWGQPSAWTERRPIFGPRSRPVLIPPWRVRDIDDEEDWARAEAIFRRTKESAS